MAETRCMLALNRFTNVVEPLSSKGRVIVGDETELSWLGFDRLSKGVVPVPAQVPQTMTVQQYLDEQGLPGPRNQPKKG